jgi:NadR type nicotinamide-nucleotide adenylyltransferase
MLRVVVTGSECTGKTTLAKALANHYDTVLVPEHARQFVQDLGRAPEVSDVDAIARGQIASEDALADAASKILIQDTDLLSTIVYSRHYYGDCPDWIEDALPERAADLYLLCDIDVPWLPDGDQRDRPDRREEMHHLFRQALLDRDLEFVDIRGSLDHRVNLAARAINLLLLPWN